MGSIYTNAVSPPWQPAEDARRGGRTLLAEALRGARARSLALFASYEAALGEGLRIPRSHEVNLPLWELGHIGWFADWWIARNPQRADGLQADPEVARLPARRSDADALYDSSRVPHASRWSLDLPGVGALRTELHASLSDTLAWLERAAENDSSLYFFRLALFHEDMHTEAAVYMAQTLGFDPFAQGAEPFPEAANAVNEALVLPGMDWAMGHAEPGFAFDNELPRLTAAVGPTRIDSAPVNWARYLPFVESGAADRREHWSAAGWAWRQTQTSGAPRYLRHRDGAWQTQCWGRWQVLDLQAPARHLSAFEAEAWCHWAQRRLPTEAEWEAAAHALPDFQWGQVWEWTASAFTPFPGFEPHPYRDYSAPWFDGRPVLKGASPATAPRMRHPRYRNFFPAARNDILAGFRSVG